MLFGIAVDPWMPIFWLIVVIIITVVEVNTYQLVAVWFAVGGLAGLLASIFHAGILVQMLIFTLTSLVCLAATRPLVTKVLKVNKVKTNFDRILGTTAVAITQITPEQKGRIMVDGLDWSASSLSTIEKGEKVLVLKVEGVTALVEKISDSKYQKS